MRRGFGIVVVLVALGAAAAGCGSSKSATAPASASASAIPVSPDMETLSVAVVTVGSALTADSELGITKGFFKAHQLTVNLTTGAGANIPNLIVSGQVDLATGDATPLLTAAKGKSTTVVRGQIGFGTSADLATKPSVTSVDQLRAKQGCKIAAFSQGSAAYGTALTMIKALNIPNCSLLVFPTAAAVAGAVVAGNADGGVLAQAAWQTALDAGQVHLLVDSAKPADKALLGQSLGFTSNEWYGLTDTVKAKSSAVIKFIAGLNDAIAYMKSAPSAEVAQSLKTSPDYAAATAASLAVGIDVTKGFFDSVTGPGGVITEADWNGLLKGIPLWEVPGYVPDAANDAYSARVDMTYAKQALKMGSK